MVGALLHRAFTRFLAGGILALLVGALPPYVARLVSEY